MIGKGSANDSTQSVGDADDGEQERGRFLVGSELLGSGGQEHERHEEAEESDETGKAEQIERGRFEERKLNQRGNGSHASVRFLLSVRFFDDFRNLKRIKKKRIIIRSIVNQ